MVKAELAPQNKAQKEVIAHVGDTGIQKLFEPVNNNLFTGPEVMDKLTESRLGRHKQYIIPRFASQKEFSDFVEITGFVHI